MISQGADIESNTTENITPLHLASHNGHLDVVQYLYSKGANIESKTTENATPLHYGTLFNHFNIVEYLISKGANIESKNYENKTPLHLASWCFTWGGHLNIVISKLFYSNFHDNYLSIADN